jgi:hypothetical protein
LEKTIPDGKMPKRFHFCLDVKGALKNWKTKDFRNMFKRKDGSLMRPDEARAALIDELAKGNEFIPMSECDNFDFKQGCLGHDD